MVNTSSRPRYFLDIDTELRRQVKATAALQGKTMKEWLTEAIIEKLEDDIDAGESLKALNDRTESISLREYLKSHQRT
jgi:hypothetical protein